MSETPDKFEVAPSGRSRCRACGRNIEKSQLRFGEVLESSYGDGDGTAAFWFHPRCAAHRRPEKFVVIARDEQAAAGLPDREVMITEAELGLALERLPRLAGAERASSGRARCRHCKELIPAGVWRIKLSTFAETGFFDPLGFLHVSCAAAYFEIAAIGDRLQQAAPELTPADLVEISSLIGG